MRSTSCIYIPFFDCKWLSRSTVYSFIHVLGFVSFCWHFALFLCSNKLLFLVSCISLVITVKNLMLSLTHVLPADVDQETSQSPKPSASRRVIYSSDSDDESEDEKDASAGLHCHLFLMIPLLLS